MIPPLRILSCLTATLVSTLASPPSKGGTHHTAPKHEPGYQEESPLPKDWPTPGPFNQVVRKQYPAYRAAFTPGTNSNSSFRQLFKHISRNQIPMTAPVAMKLGDDPAAGMEEMAFLYQSPKVGAAGHDGELVEVRDMPAQQALSYAWQGGRDNKLLTKAREALDAELAKLNLKPAGYRLLGYNSPFMPRAKQTHELQALLK